MPSTPAYASAPKFTLNPSNSGQIYSPTTAFPPQPSPHLDTSAFPSLTSSQSPSSPHSLPSKSAPIPSLLHHPPPTHSSSLRIPPCGSSLHPNSSSNAFAAALDAGSYSPTATQPYRQSAPGPRPGSSFLATHTSRGSRSTLSCSPTYPRAQQPPTNSSPVSTSRWSCVRP